MLTPRQEHLLVWLWQCHGLTDAEVEAIGEPGDDVHFEELARKGLVRRTDMGWAPGVLQ